MPALSPEATNRIRLVLAVGIVIVTAAVYMPIIGHDFINFDDNSYITENDFIKGGVTLPGLRWAFTTMYQANWHPLTWLSHMLDIEIYGLRPGGHHLTSLLLHEVNALLLFRLLLISTGAAWRSGAVAFLFAVHPLHVESVAWAAERKDVLSAFFFLMTLTFYCQYVQSPSARRYILTLAAFSLGLMAKPMLVSVPLLLLLFDYWPYGRIGRGGVEAAGGGAVAPPVAVGRLVLEKVPFAVIALASCIVTLYAQTQGRAVAPVTTFPLAARLSNALVGYGTYLAKTICPARLSVFYPLTLPTPQWQVVTASVIFVVISLLVVRNGRRRPYLLTGWLWYLVSLLPVIGIVQVGGQSIADRYTYIPLIGIFLLISWGVRDLMKGGEPLRRAAIPLVALVLLAFTIQCALQVRYWKNDLTLFSHALEVTERNFVAEKVIADDLQRRGLNDEALRHYQLAFDHCTLSPARRALIARNLAKSLATAGRINEAISKYLYTIQWDPGDTGALLGLGTLLEQKGEVAEAINYYRKVLTLDPTDDDARLRLGRALARSWSGIESP
jgi:protein O-mannosyl-transferase